MMFLTFFSGIEIRISLVKSEILADRQTDKTIDLHQQTPVHQNHIFYLWSND